MPKPGMPLDQEAPGSAGATIENDLGRLGTMPVTDPTHRFSTRVENYIRFRPGYPPAVLDLLRAECGLTPATCVADIASGTGWCNVNNQAVIDYWDQKWR